MSAPIAYAILFDGIVLHLRRTKIGIESLVASECAWVDAPVEIVPLYAETPDLHYLRATTCSVCGREWTAVFPVAAERVECPSCGQFSAVSLPGDEQP